jgi:uncharacterized protein (UPF0332 family)
MSAAQAELMKKARESLGAAEHLATGGYYDFAVARAYYAMFYAAQALLLGQGRTFSQHGSLLSAVGQYLVKTGMIPAHLHRNLINAYNARIEGDYEPGGKFTQPDAALHISHAEEFITIAEKLLAPPSAATNQSTSDQP